MSGWRPVTLVFGGALLNGVLYMIFGPRPFDRGFDLFEFLGIGVLAIVGCVMAPKVLRQEVPFSPLLRWGCTVASYMAPISFGAAIGDLIVIMLTHGARGWSPMFSDCAGAAVNFTIGGLIKSTGGDKDPLIEGKAGG